MNYGELQTDFLNLLNRRDCTTSQAQSLIQKAIQRIQRELRTPLLEAVTTVTVPNPYTGGITIPADYLELIDLIPLTSNGAVTDMKRLEKCDISTANITAQSTGLPRQYSRDATVWVLGPSPLSGDTIKVKYYAFMGALSSGTDTNAVSASAPDLITYGALSYAGDFFTDKRIAQWEARYQQILMDLQGSADDDEEHGAAAVQPAFAYPDDFDNGCTSW